MNIRSFFLGLQITLSSIWMKIFHYYVSHELKNLGINPRLHVYGTVNLWGAYCKVPWSEIKRLKSFEIISIFIRHVRIIDDFVDDILRPKNIEIQKNAQKDISWDLVSLLAQKIKSLPINQKIKREIIKIFQEYRQRIFIAFVEEGAFGHDVETSIVLKQRADITGFVYTTFIRLLNTIHNIPEQRAQEAEKIFTNWGLSLQISDDILDFQKDRNNVQNLVVSSAKSHYDETQPLFQKAHMARRWAKKNIPKIYTELVQLLNSYLGAMIAQNPKNPVVQIMNAISRIIFFLVFSRLPRKLYKF